MTSTQRGHYSRRGHNCSLFYVLHALMKLPSQRHCSETLNCRVERHLRFPRNIAHNNPNKTFWFKCLMHTSERIKCFHSTPRLSIPMKDPRRLENIELPSCLQCTDICRKLAFPFLPCKLIIQIISVLNFVVATCFVGAIFVKTCPDFRLAFGGCPC